MEVIRIENLSKLYDLGQVGTGTLNKDLNRWWAKVRGQEDPFAKVGLLNDRTKKASANDTVWALKGVNFSVSQGEVVGIIGRNGAGKSTLLKIISRITTPTSGSIKIKGRIASLLEVGTGFHPEMTGRENIFMNGTLLGMSRREIQSKLDEIIDFAGVAMYIDTPVKRYSSGMQVRLGFAVAAYLEPEILIIDEVLAVGDAEFQKKAVGRMREVSKGDGRTVLFVSHNMEAIQNLCDRGVVLLNGTKSYEGGTKEAVNFYLKTASIKKESSTWPAGQGPGNEVSRLRSVKVSHPNNNNQIIDTESGFIFEVEIENLFDSEVQLDVTYHLTDEQGILVNVSSSGTTPQPHSFNKCVIKGKSFFPGSVLNEGQYTISRLLLVKDRGNLVTEWNDVVSFTISKAVAGKKLGLNVQKEGVVATSLAKWNLENEPLVKEN